MSSVRTDDAALGVCGILPTEVVSGVAAMGAPPEESPLATRVALEATAGNVEVALPEAFDTGPSAPTCEALVASAQLEDRYIPSAGPRGLTEHPLLLPESLELETQMLPACCCDELQTGLTLE